MIDYVKIWSLYRADIIGILANDRIEFTGSYNRNTGEVSEYPLLGKWREWEFEIKSPTWLEITGSLHKFWNKGTNGNDFHFNSLLHSIIDLCNGIQINPLNLTVHNLEFGVNVRPEINASTVLTNIVCYKNRESIKGISKGKYFLEFPMDKYYVKIYDKGLQAREIWASDIGNVFRFEVKAMNSAYFANAGIKTLVDLLDINKLKVLGKKIDNVFKDVVFDDHTIDYKILKPHDQRNYLLLNNPREWVKSKGKKTTTILARENRFRAIVGKYGALNLHCIFSTLIASKWTELTTVTPDDLRHVADYLEHCKLCGNSYLIYTPKINKVPLIRKCLSCGKDITKQNPTSKYCSAKFVGEKQAHKCRNDHSNPKNNFKRQLGRVYQIGQTLFDIVPFLKLKSVS